MTKAETGPKDTGTAADGLPSDPRLAALRGSWAFYAIMLIAVGLGPLAMSSFMPALPAVQDAFGVTADRAQLAISLSMLAIGVFTLIYGPLSDRFGRRPILVFAIGLGLFGSIVGALAGSIEVVIFGRILQAAGTAAGVVLARAIVKDVYGPERMTGVIGTLTAALMLAPMAGPFLGGFAVARFDWWGPFAVIAAITALVWALVLLRLPETHHFADRGTSTAQMARDFGGLFVNRAYMGYALHGVVVQGAFFAFLGGAPYLVSDVYGQPPSAYGAYFITLPLGFMAGNLVAGIWGSRIGNDRLIALGTLVSIAATAAALWVAQSDLANPYWLFAPVGLAMIGNGLALPGSQSGSVAAAPLIAGSASGLFSAMQALFAAAVLQWVGAWQGADAGSALPTLIPMTGLMVAAPLVYAALVRPWGRPARAVTAPAE
ncbi:DHA1 family bicyclomycin/chloramphenicol resistance-like MFS transporter [Rhodothalassium salexigens DSM 2132]|uniref:Bcr/CflA family efflux transporter n=1 Tax=Rhodothalassium salexigens DSM 2132 TaxID=1188247 RepID=A0A4R2PF29_RHOSA|nr:multidrug effflux MFS transporter [Rhodothalassium salexigens]MBB4211820.1 DHA1 family bicyclomycin/chloramphenicol resistance-like MFS transporter [Rhodothalassium salexigens DSM 2132]MBK1638155.1 hypothetical protein [Rhodothalassium salexigens DSM 2132]TCP33882.1 DHA1 family bicyclomycin/chloramphenicol resistance-like MFS transporter [Rhodothalassium salexigens DSM 2132]